jgi:aryl-alcohol dehydrogenase-like predicted oxidoreductase
MLSKITLANTDLSVSRLCYGTNMLGTAIPQTAADAILDRFADLGGNFIDTARAYGDWIPDAPKGASERAVGAWLKGRNRDDFVIATKGGFFDLRVGDYRNRVTPEDIQSDLDESLEHLGVSVIDLYWLHSDNPQAPVGPIVDALIKAQKAGSIRWFGASNWSPERVLEANAYARSVDHAGFVAIQPFWGLARPNAEAAAAQGYGLYYEDGFAAVHAEGLAVVPYAGQSRGVFTKADRDGLDGLPDALKAMYGNAVNARRLAAVQAVAARHGASVNAVVLSYLLSQPLQTIPIFGGSSPEQIADSVRAAALTLTPQELDELKAD